MGLAVTVKHSSSIMVLPPNIAINHRAFGTGLKTATRFLAGYGRRQVNIMVYLIFSIVMVLIIVFIVPHPKYTDPIKYTSRSCNGRQWKKHFPDAQNDEIRRFLAGLAEAMGFDESDILKFSPTDKVIDIYLSNYGDETPICDDMECERFAMFICDELKVPSEKLKNAWETDDFTLGDAFLLTQKSISI